MCFNNNNNNNDKSLMVCINHTSLGFYLCQPRRHEC